MKKLLLVKPRGFCAGVVRAINTVERALELWGAPIYVKHQIVHNRYVVEALKTKGAVFVEDLSTLKKGSRVIYSAHGVSPSVRKQTKDLGLIEIDATCCLVEKIHVAIRHYVELGYHILFIGHKKHVEVIGASQECPPTSITIIESLKDLDPLSFTPTQKLFCVMQTTLSIMDVNSLVEALMKKYPQIKMLPKSSICYATTNRQKAVIHIAKQTDLVLVVGDPNSSNSNRLREVAQKCGVTSYMINDENEIDPLWIEKATTIGMTAGASTPESIVQKCVAKIQSLGVNTVEEIIYTTEDVVFPLPKPVREENL